MIDQKDPWIGEASDKDVVDPLSEVARRDRTSLLVCNLLLFAVVQIGLVPKQLTIEDQTIDLDRHAVIILASVLLAYYLLSFAMTIGAEYRAWRARLETLRERRLLRAHYYLEQRLEYLRKDRMAGLVEPGRPLEELEASYIAMVNRTNQAEWVRYKKWYEIRMILDGCIPIVLTSINVGAAIYKFVS